MVTFQKLSVFHVFKYTFVQKPAFIAEVLSVDCCHLFRNYVSAVIKPVVICGLLAY